MADPITKTEVDLQIKNLDAQIKRVDLRIKQRTDRNAAHLTAAQLRKEIAEAEKSELAAAAARRAEANALTTDLDQRTGETLSDSGSEVDSHSRRDSGARVQV